KKKKNDGSTPLNKDTNATAMQKETIIVVAGSKDSQMDDEYTSSEEGIMALLPSLPTTQNDADDAHKQSIVTLKNSPLLEPEHDSRYSTVQNFKKLALTVGTAMKDIIQPRVWLCFFSFSSIFWHDPLSFFFFFFFKLKKKIKKGRKTFFCLFTEGDDETGNAAHNQQKSQSLESSESGLLGETEEKKEWDEDPDTVIVDDTDLTIQQHYDWPEFAIKKTRILTPKPDKDENALTSFPLVPDMNRDGTNVNQVISETRGFFFFLL
ncbi:hypothetical protein RFI_14074, partial [Reticulomyxa filosa]